MRLVSFLVAASASLAFAGDVVVQTTYGTVKGYSNGVVDQWDRIPFAAPPVGDLRLAHPVPPTPWNGTKDVSGIPASCPQLKLDGDLLLGDEDCLYLRVWRPTDIAPGQRLPVLVWLFGGGWILGSSDEFGLYDGTNLATKHNVIIVAPNYRLGSLGFMALPELAANAPNGSTGNMGLADQTAALKWVQENIAAFGGDPSTVLIFGESAGGFSVCYHLASPLSAGLFHGAIMESGSCDSVQFFREYNRSVAFSYEFAAAIGCDNLRGPPLVDCLRRQSTEDMIKSILDWFDPNWPFTNKTDGLNLTAAESHPPAPDGSQGSSRLYHLRDAVAAANPLSAKAPNLFRPSWLPVFAPVMPWAATVDGVALKGLPLWHIRKGDWNAVPWLAGTNKNEATILMPLMPFVVKGASFEFNDHDARLMLQQLLSEYGNPQIVEEVTNATLQQYPEADYPNGFWRVSMAFTHYFFSCGTRRSLVAGSKQAPAYMYTFERKLSFLAGLMEDLLGDFHSSELPFVWNNELPFIFDFDADDRALSEAMGTWWTSMARWHDPNAEGEGLPTWPLYNTTSDASMTLAHPPSVKSGYEKGNCDFWDRMQCLLDPQGASCPTAPFPF